MKRFKVVLLPFLMSDIESTVYIYGDDEKDAREIAERQNPSAQVKSVTEF